jgi:hypothetical protein
MKHSARKISKKYLPKGLIRKLDKSDGKRKWFLGKDKKWDTLHKVVLDLGYTTEKKSLDSRKDI